MLSTNETPERADKLLTLRASVDAVLFSFCTAHRISTVWREGNSVVASPQQFGGCSGAVRWRFGVLQWHESGNVYRHNTNMETALRLKNATDIPDEVVREVIRFTKPSGVAGFDVRVGNASDCVLKGKAYTRGSGYHDTADPFVNLYIGAAWRFPRGPRPPVRSNYLPQPYFADRVEALVFIAAHELRHLWQSRVARGRRVWGARGQFSERDADAYAIKMLRAWRNQ